MLDCEDLARVCPLTALAEVEERLLDVERVCPCCGRPEPEEDVFRLFLLGVLGADLTEPMDTEEPVFGNWNIEAWLTSIGVALGMSRSLLLLLKTDDAMVEKLPMLLDLDSELE